MHILAGVSVVIKQGDGLPTAKGKRYQEISLSEKEHLLTNPVYNFLKQASVWQCKGRLYTSRV